MFLDHILQFGKGRVVTHPTHCSTQFDGVQPSIFVLVKLDESGLEFVDLLFVKLVLV
jgi:hypothetical protein